MNRNELINKYVDNELTIKEIEETNELIKKDEEFNKLISTHKFVHETLAQIPLKNASQGFTDLVMKKLINRISEKYRKNYFFRFALATFGVILVITLFFFFYFLSDLGLVQNTYQTANNYTDKFLPILKKIADFFKTDIFKILTGIISFIILIGFYFNINLHNSFKNRINEY
jgi:hypothetical protein